MDDAVLFRLIDRYNGLYNTDFAVTEVRREEVLFAQIEVTEYALRDIFNLGYQLREWEQNLRDKGELV